MILTLPQTESELIRRLLPFLSPSEERQVWLVGGALRDLLLGKKELPDLDLAVSFDPTEPCRRFAAKTHAGYVVLDDERHIVRMVSEGRDGKSYTFDVSQFRADTFDGDLQLRDFTINAAAAPLFGEGMKLIEQNSLRLYDPLKGAEALENRKVIMCSPNSFKDDPLRIMRAFRFCALYDSELSEDLISHIEEDRDLLVNVSGERIRDELFKIFSVPFSIKYIRKMSETGVIDVILPELSCCRGVTQNEWHHLDVFDHTLMTLENLEKLLSMRTPHPWWSDFEAYLDSSISGPRTFRQALKFAAILHDLGKIPCRHVDKETGKVTFHCHEMEGGKIAESISQRLKLSAAEIAYYKKAVKNHMRPGIIIQQGLDEGSGKKLFRYYSECGEDGAAIAILSLADRFSALGQCTQQDVINISAGIYEIMDIFYQQINVEKPQPLITGKTLISMGAKPGPIFKTIIDAVSEAQFTGEITTPAEAAALAQQLLASDSPNS